MSTTTANKLANRHNYLDKSGADVSALTTADESRITPETAYDEAYRLDRVSSIVAGFDNLAELSGSADDWAAKGPKGIEGGPQLYEVVKRSSETLYSPSSIAADADRILVSFMERKLASDIARAKVSDNLETTYGGDLQAGAKAELPNVLRDLDATITNLSGKASLSPSEQRELNVCTARKTTLEKLQTKVNDPTDPYVIGAKPKHNTPANFLRTANDLEANPKDKTLQKKANTLKKHLDQRKDELAAEEILFTGIARLDSGKYVDKTKAATLDDLADLITPAKSKKAKPATTPAAAAPAAPTTPEAKKEKKVSPEIIREQRKLASIRGELATLQARAGFSSLGRASLRADIKKLEAQFNAQIKRTAMFEMIDDELVDIKNLSPEDAADVMAQYAEDRTAKAYLELAAATKAEPGSKTMEFFAKHGTKIVLGATALGFVLGGPAGAIAFAAGPKGMQTMAKRYTKNRGKQYDRLLNSANIDENKKTFHTNNVVRTAAYDKAAAVKKPKIEASDSDATKQKKQAKYLQEVYNAAFDAAGDKAANQFDRASQKEFVSNYLGSMAIGAATGAAVYVGGHMVGNALHYQMFGGDGSIRQAVDHLFGYGPDGPIAYTPTHNSVGAGVFSNFQPLNHW